MRTMNMNMQQHTGLNYKHTPFKHKPTRSSKKGEPVCNTFSIDTELDWIAPYVL